MIEFNDLVRKIKLARKYIGDQEYQEAYNTLYLPPEFDSNQVQAVVMPNKVVGGGNDLATEVKQDIENRIIKGVQTYGERLRPFNGRDALLDAYEECLDQALYLKQELTERQAIQEQAKVKQNACGQKLLKAMLELKYNPDKNMMPTVKRIESSNGGMTTYLRHDAVVKYCNENFFSKHSV